MKKITPCHNNFLSRTMLGASVFSALSLYISTVQAQDFKLEEVIVTAQKRAQSTQDVPISLSTFSEDSLQKAGIDSVKNLDAITPGVVFQSSLSSAGEGVRVRGIGSAGFNTGIEQSVSVVIDGVVTGPSGSGLSNLWDVERVEILRGPQGTLFGKNASAGAINVVSNRPGDEFEAALGLQYEAQYEGTKVDGFVSGPITNKIKGRLAAFSFNQEEGIVENILSGETTNKKDQMGIRAILDYDGDIWSSKLTASFDKINHECCTRTFRGIDATSASPLTLGFLMPALARTGLEISENNRQTINNAKMYEKGDTTHVAIEVSREFNNGHSFKSITGYRNWDHAEANDADVIDLDLVFSEQARDLKVYTQEFQLLSPTDQKLEYVAGLYFYRQSFDEDTVISGGSDFPAALGGGFGRTIENSTVEVDNYALFGHLTYHITDQLQTYIGARILHEEIVAEGIRFEDPTVGGHFAFPGNLPGGRTEGNDDNGVGTIGIQYFTESDSMYYAKISRGYKGHAIDTSFDSDLYRGDPNNITLLDPETVVSTEFGNKSFFFDRKLSVDIGFFYSEFKGFQTSAFDGNKVAFVLKNAGDVQTKGFELDLAATPWQGGLINLYLSYTDGEFAEFKGAPCTVPDKAANNCSPSTGGQDLSGKKLNDTPEWKYTLVLQQDFNLSDNIQAYVRGQYAWRDEVIKSGDLDPNTYLDSYGVASFRTGLTFGDTWELSLFVDNAFDEDYELTIFDAPLFEGAYSQYKAPERTYGLDVRMFF